MSESRDWQVSGGMTGSEHIPEAEKHVTRPRADPSHTLQPTSQEQGSLLWQQHYQHNNITKVDRRNHGCQTPHHNARTAQDETTGDGSTHAQAFLGDIGKEIRHRLARIIWQY
ncbi:hypothetical protein O3P69_001807 [Scylla paramamosain]|uniref:Uncharacterized protein n=1 Tax=Scylla paramamosain TaxID=85552 RepID=A0AAW0UZF2_SCYPA